MLMNDETNGETVQPVTPKGPTCKLKCASTLSEYKSVQHMPYKTTNNARVTSKKT